MRFLNPVSLEVDQEKINLYADITDDWNPLHTDPEFAAGTEMKGVIAHGTMSVNLIWQALTAAFGLETAGRTTLDIRFLRPVRVGDTVTAGGNPDDDDPSLWRVWVRNQRGEEVIGGTARFRVDS
ncbi:MAG: MaoC family dehydratase [Deltaproteobacteria bacterium]|nr:MaoC family dehydratase [Deltaproteobacteria bacterium]